MDILNLPLEILRVILEHVVCYLDYFDLIELRRVNKLFAQEVITAISSVHHPQRVGIRMPFAPYNLRKTTNSRSRDQKYLVRTVRDVTDRIMERLDSRLAGENNTEQEKQEQKEQIALDIARVAAGDTDWKYLSKEQRAPMSEHLLSVAARVEDLSLIKQLVDDVKHSVSDIFGEPLNNAARKGHVEIVRFLLSKGVDWEGENLIMRDFKEEDGLMMHGEPATDTSALEAAALGGHEQVLSLAAVSGNAALVKLLYEEVIDCFSPIWEDFWSHTLLVAAYNGKTEVVPYLLEKGAQIDYTRYAENPTALEFAALKGHNDMVRLLLEKGADINGGPNAKPGKYAFKKSPLLLAALKHGFPRTVALLLDKGASVYPKTHLLESAAVKAPVCVVRVLLEKSVHKRCEGGGKALKIVMDKGRQEVVDLFKLYGITLDGEWTRLEEGVVIWQEKSVNSARGDRASLYSLSDSTDSS